MKHAVKEAYALHKVALACGALLAATTACGPATLVNAPCDDLGDEVCEGPAPLRCDGRRWQKIGECAGSCLQAIQTEHDEQRVTGEVTWTCLESTHVVKQSITVTSGSTLTIEPGVVLRLDPASRITTEPGGRIVAEGTELVPILVTSNNETQGGFGGLAEGGINVYANRTGEPSIIREVIIERGIHGLGVFGLEPDVTPPVVENSTFRDNLNYGIIVRACSGGPTIPDFAAAGNQFFGNGEGEVSVCDPP